MKMRNIPEDRQLTRFPRVVKPNIHTEMVEICKESREILCSGREKVCVCVCERDTHTRYKTQRIRKINVY